MCFPQVTLVSPDEEKTKKKARVTQRCELAGGNHRKPMRRRIVGARESAVGPENVWFWPRRQPCEARRMAWRLGRSGRSNINIRIIKLILFHFITSTRINFQSSLNYNSAIWKNRRHEERVFQRLASWNGTPHLRPVSQKLDFRSRLWTSSLNERDVQSHPSA